MDADWLERRQSGDCTTLTSLPCASTCRVTAAPVINTRMLLVFHCPVIGKVVVEWIKLLAAGRIAHPLEVAPDFRPDDNQRAVRRVVASSALRAPSPSARIMTCIAAACSGIFHHL